MNNGYDSVQMLYDVYGPQPCEIAASSLKLELDKPYTFPKGHEKLTGNKLFTDNNPSIGLPNITNISGVLDSYERLKFFGQLLANEHRNMYTQSLGSYPRKDEYGKRYSFIYKGGFLHWIRENCTEESGTIFDMITSLYGIDNLQQQVEKLAASLKFDFCSLSKVKMLEQNCLLDSSTTYHNNLPHELNMFDATKQHTKAIVRNRAEILGPQGHHLASWYLYEWKNSFFCIPAILETPIPTFPSDNLPTLTMGKFISPAVFLNQNYFAKYPDAKVIFCQDLRTGIKIDELLRKDNSYDPANFFVTSIFGLDLPKYTWSYLSFRNIIFCPAPTINSLALLKLYKDYCYSQGQGSFKILDHFILPYLKANTIDPALSDAERYILSHSSSLPDSDKIQTYLHLKIKDVLTYEKYKQRYQSLGIFKRESCDINSDKEQNEVPQSIILPPSDPNWEVSMPTRLEAVRINHIIKPGNFIFVIGVKNSGKTQLSYLLIKNALHESSDLPIFSSHMGTPFTNIFLIDGESEKSIIESQLTQHGLFQKFGKELHILSRLQDELPPWCEDFTLTNSNFRNGITKELQQKKCRLLLIDNLTDLLGSAVNYANKASEVINWIRMLQKSGVCVILFHHKSEGNSRTNPDKTDGSQIFKKLARTIINCFGKREIIIKNLGTSEVQRLAKLPGLTVGIAFDVCKSVPLLEEVTIWANLPYMSGSWKYISSTDSNGNDVNWHPSSPPALELNPTVSSEVDSLAGNGTGFVDNGHKSVIPIEKIHPKAQIVYEKLLSVAGYVKLKDLVSKLTCEKGLGEDTIRKILKLLNENGFVEIRGKNQGTTYKAISLQTQ